MSDSNAIMNAHQDRIDYDGETVEEEEEEVEEDDDRLWPTSIYPSMLRDGRTMQCERAVIQALVQEVAQDRWSQTGADIDQDGAEEVWTMINDSSVIITNEFLDTPLGEYWFQIAKYYIRRRVSLIEFTRQQSSEEKLAQWATRVCNKVLNDPEYLRMAHERWAEGQARNERIAAGDRELWRRTLVRAGRVRRLDEGKITTRVNKEMKDVRKRAQELREDDVRLAAEESHQLNTTSERRAQIQNERAEIAISLTDCTLLHAAKKEYLEEHHARTEIRYERERRDINRLTPRHRLLKRGRR